MRQSSFLCQLLMWYYISTSVVEILKCLENLEIQHPYLLQNEDLDTGTDPLEAGPSV